MRHVLQAMEKAYLSIRLDDPQGLLKGPHGTFHVMFAAGRHEYLLVSHDSFSFLAMMQWKIA